MNRYSTLILALLAGAISAISAPAQAAAAPEMRACWISRFEWPGGTEAQCKARITNMMQTLKAANFNAVLFQIRGECDTLYPNPYEPWGPQFSWSDPGWDPAAYAIQEAHANGLEFHAYINTHTLASSVPPADTVPQHQFNIHGPSAVGDQNWLIHDQSGQPVLATDSYYWMSPANPDVSAWTRQAVLYVVENYDIDGLHFDRIRTPASTYSHDPKAEARFAGDGNPDHLAWGDFMRSQITNDLRRIYGATMARKPYVKITSAPFGICRKQTGGYQGTGTESYFSWYQDSFGWMEAHVMDAIFPQIYWQIGSAHPYEVLLGDFLKHTGGRHIYPGSITTNDYIAQVVEARRQNAPGTTVFSFNSVDFGLYSTVYAEPAPVPAMPWKDNPTTGIIIGTVRNRTNSAVVLDSKINVAGDPRNYLSAADGFYSVLDLAPGQHTITASKNGIGDVTEVFTISAGDVLEINLDLSTGIPGDVTDDGTITPTDAQAAFECYLNGSCGAGKRADLADFCTNGSITPQDANAIFALSIGLTPSCP